MGVLINPDRVFCSRDKHSHLCARSFVDVSGVPTPVNCHARHLDCRCGAHHQFVSCGGTLYVMHEAQIVDMSGVPTPVNCHVRNFDRRCGAHHWFVCCGGTLHLVHEAQIVDNRGMKVVDDIGMKVVDDHGMSVICDSTV